MSENQPDDDDNPAPSPVCFAPVANYYGTPYVTRRNGVPVIGLEDHDSTTEKEVSEAFYHAWIREFTSAES